MIIDGQMPDGEAEPRLGSTAADDVVDALDDFDAADHAFQRRTREALRMGETDLRALRFLIMARADGRVVSARELADHLGLAASSATTVIDRLTARGHVRRAAHPSDRRRVAIEVIDGDIAQTLSPTGHERMLAAAATLGESEVRLIVAFLDRIRIEADSASFCRPFGPPGDRPPSSRSMRRHEFSGTVHLPELPAEDFPS